MKTLEASRRQMLAGLLAAASTGAVLPRVALAAETSGTRIVSLGGATTEILFALGLGDRVVARDLSSYFPAAARQKPNVGYYRAISAEGVLALAPDLVIASDGSGPREAMDVLSSASVKLVHLAELRSAGDIAARIRSIAQATGEAERGEALAAAVDADLKMLAEDVSRISPRRRTLALLGSPTGGLMAAGSQSSGQLALTLAGAENAAAAISGWKPLTDEAAYGMAPDAIVLVSTQRPLSPDDVARHAALSASPAAKEGRIASVDALGFVGFGPRAAHAAQAVARRIYPEAAFRDLPQREWLAEGRAG